jgi:prepilin-type N-terminal cleavage/methylation domain-containing protein
MIILHGSEPRRGVTLLEVLTAIFIMGIGLLAILVLFPLGALSMAKAVRDDRAAVTGANASALANAMDVRNDPNVLTLVSSRPQNDNPVTPRFLPPNPDGPGYPVYVDPQYSAPALTAQARALGQLPAALARATITPGAQRTAVSFAPGNNNQALTRWFTFQDEMQFDPSGLPTGNGAIFRPGTYTWGFLLRRPRSSSPALTELSVVVYANRPADRVTGESTYAVTPNAGANPPQNVSGASTVLIDYGSVNATAANRQLGKPNIRKGGWILDSTYQLFNAAGQPVPPFAGAAAFGTVNGYFYQVNNVIDDGKTTTLQLDIPLRGWSVAPAPPTNVTSVVIMENVITVLDRGTSTRP